MGGLQHVLGLENLKRNHQGAFIHAPTPAPAVYSGQNRWIGETPPSPHTHTHPNTHTNIINLHELWIHSLLFTFMDVDVHVSKVDLLLENLRSKQV